MKCPYRIKLTVKVNARDREVTRQEYEDYAECTQECPFYDEVDGICLRAEAEIGGT